MAFNQWFLKAMLGLGATGQYVEAVVVQFLIGGLCNWAIYDKIW